MIETIINLALSALLILCSIEDIRFNKIPNKYTMPAILAGLVLMTIHGGLPGMKDSLLGFLLSVALFFIPFAIGAMGAGDLKLMAAIGALKGLQFTISALLATALAGGAVVIVYMIYKKKMKTTLLRMFGLIIRPAAKYIYIRSGNSRARKAYEYFENQKNNSEPIYIPYAVPISIGTFLVLSGAFSHLPFF